MLGSRKGHTHLHQLSEGQLFSQLHLLVEVPQAVGCGVHHENAALFEA